MKLYLISIELNTGPAEKGKGTVSR